MQKQENVVMQKQDTSYVLELKCFQRTPSVNKKCLEQVYFLP
jgi:hypothetical protein